MSSRSNPFEELERMFDRLSRQFDDATRVWGVEEDWWPTGDRDEMAVDVADAGDEFVVTVDLPGFGRDDVTVEVSDHTLHVEADRDETTEEAEEGAYLRRERTHRSLSRAIRLPDEVDRENVSARLHNGVLTVTVEKAEPTTEPRRIDIEDE
jgi:HSP20 family protein